MALGGESTKKRDITHSCHENELDAYIYIYIYAYIKACLCIFLILQLVVGLKREAREHMLQDYSVDGLRW